MQHSPCGSVAASNHHNNFTPRLRGRAPRERTNVPNARDPAHQPLPRMTIIAELEPSGSVPTRHSTAQFLLAIAHRHKSRRHATVIAHMAAHHLLQVENGPMRTNTAKRLSRLVRQAAASSSGGAPSIAKGVASILGISDEQIGNLVESGFQRCAKEEQDPFWKSALGRALAQPEKLILLQQL